MESSAKSGFNCKNIFMEAAKMLYIDHLNYKDRSMSKGSLSDMLNEKINNEKNQKVNIQLGIGRVIGDLPLGLIPMLEHLKKYKDSLLKNVLKMKLFFLL